MCEASILGSGDFGTLPIDEIALQIVPNDKITDSGKFMIENGKITKKITQCDFDRIIQEYNDTISASEISSILQTLGRNEVVQDGKNGLNDCLQDGTVRIFTEQEEYLKII